LEGANFHTEELGGISEALLVVPKIFKELNWYAEGDIPALQIHD
jgi:hypothetical protein